MQLLSVRHATERARSQALIIPMWQWLPGSVATRYPLAPRADLATMLNTSGRRRTFDVHAGHQPSLKSVIHRGSDKFTFCRI
jgi:hypothetical protein